jgi:hypothetical protein
MAGVPTSQSLVAGPIVRNPESTVPSPESLIESLIGGQEPATRDR